MLIVSLVELCGSSTMGMQLLQPRKIGQSWQLMSQLGHQLLALRMLTIIAIYSLTNITESTIATGDDEGCIKVWDTRQRICCNSFNAHEDYVSDMTFASDSSKLLATSGDGTLSVCNLRSNKVQTRSEFSEEELSL